MKKGFVKSIMAFLPVFSFTLTYIIYQYLSSGAARYVHPLQLLYTIIKVFIFLAGFSFIAQIVIKDKTKAGLAVLFTTALWFFSEKFFVFSVIISSLLVFPWVGILVLHKKKILFKEISILLSVLGFGLTIVLLAGTVPWNLYLRRTPEIRETPNSSLNVPVAPPDIYYIILDGYVRSDVLRELFGFDNSDFTKYLTEKGFIIPENNLSNYIDTAYSVGSTLNMQYIQTLMPDAKGLPFKWLMSPVIENSQVKDMLEESGYQSVAVFVDWELTNIENVDMYLKPLPIQIDIFEQILFKSSPLRIFSPVTEKLTLMESYPSHKQTVKFAFKALSDIPDFDSPKFVFAHITSPHPPFIFNKDGQPFEPTYNFSFADGVDFPGSREQYKEGYINQMQYINRQMENAIDSILEKSENPPVIIILSDHGSRMLTDSSSSTNPCIRERFSNFAAFHLPGLDDDIIPSDITSVNVFRLIFDHYFGTEFGMLENGYYFSDYEFSFDDVSSQIYTACDIMP